jgi:hypothetical protein
MKQEPTKVSSGNALNVALEERHRVAEHFVKEVEAHVIKICEYSDEGEKHGCKYADACYDGICGEDCIWWNNLKFEYGIK